MALLAEEDEVMLVREPAILPREDMVERRRAVRFVGEDLAAGSAAVLIARDHEPPYGRRGRAPEPTLGYSTHFSKSSKTCRLEIHTARRTHDPWQHAGRDCARSNNTPRLIQRRAEMIFALHHHRLDSGLSPLVE